MWTKKKEEASRDQQESDEAEDKREEIEVNDGKNLGKEERGTSKTRGRERDAE